MRLKTYLNEITELPDEEIQKIMDIGFGNFKKEVKKSKFKFWPIILLRLITAFQPFNITFWNKDFIIGHKMFKETEGITAMNIKDHNIVILLNKKQLKDLKKGNYGSVEKYIFDTLRHELIHRKQAEKYSDEYFEYINVNIDRIKAKRSNQSDIEYYGDPKEMEAYARNAVEELKHGPSDIVNTYVLNVKLLDKRLFHKFLKKLYLYIDKYGNNKTIENLKKQEKTFGPGIEDLDDILKEYGDYI